MKAIVVTSDRARTDVAVPANSHVAHVGQVVCLCPITDMRCLSFDEVADMNVTAQFGPGTQLSERADDCACADKAASEHDGKFKLDVVVDLDVGDKCRPIDPAALADNRFTAQLGVGTNHRVFAYGHAFFNISGVGRSEEHTSELQSH